MPSLELIMQQSGAEAARTAQQNAIRNDVREFRDKLREDIRQSVRNAQSAKLDAQQAAQAASQAAIDAEQGIPVPPTPPSPPTPPWITETAARYTPEAVGQQVTNVLTVGGVILFSLLVGIPLARAIARWIDRRGVSAPVPREVTSRLEAIEAAVESIAVEVERISEGQRFTTRLLSERTHEPAPDFVQGQRNRDAVPVGGSAAQPAHG